MILETFENFKEFLDLASINQGSQGWSIYGANPTLEKEQLLDILSNLKKLNHLRNRHYLNQENQTV